MKQLICFPAIGIGVIQASICKYKPRNVFTSGLLTILANVIADIDTLLLSDETIGDTDTFAKSIGDTFAAILLRILFVVVICAHIFICWHFLVTKTIFSNGYHTQQRNLKFDWKYANYVTNVKLQKFHVTTLHCSDYTSHMVCVTVRIAAQQPLMTSESIFRGLLDACCCPQCFHTVGWATGRASGL